MNKLCAIDALADVPSGVCMPPQNAQKVEQRGQASTEYILAAAVAVCVLLAALHAFDAAFSQAWTRLMAWIRLPSP
jgi:hypothetical protein